MTVEIEQGLIEILNANYADKDHNLRVAELITIIFPKWVRCDERNPTDEGRKLIQYEEHGIVRVFVGEYDPINKRWKNLLNAMVIQWLDNCPEALEVEQ